MVENWSERGMVIYLVHDSTQTPAKFSFSGKTACESRGKDINGSVFGSCSLFSNFFSNISRLVAPLPIPDYLSTFIGKTNVGAPT